MGGLAVFLLGSFDDDRHGVWGRDGGPATGSLRRAGIVTDRGVESGLSSGIIGVATAGPERATVRPP